MGKGGCGGFSCGKVWSVFEVLAGLLVLAVGVMHLINIGGDDVLADIVFSIFLIACGLCIIVYAFKTFDFVDTWFKFYTTMLGRGITLLVLGALCLSHRVSWAFVPSGSFCLRLFSSE